MNGNARTLLRVHQLCDTADQWTGTFSSCGRLAVVRFLFHFFFLLSPSGKRVTLIRVFSVATTETGTVSPGNRTPDEGNLIFFKEKSFKFIYFFLFKFIQMSQISFRHFEFI
jgi:hypothetical protein